MAMSCKLHFLLFVKSEWVTSSRLKDELSALEHRIRKCLVITATNHEGFWMLDTNLDHLEIMWEIASEVNGFVD